MKFHAGRIFPRVLAVFFVLACLVLSAGGDEDDGNVFVTASGQKYHRSGCTALSRTKISIPLAEAVKSGYEPCAICRPPAPDIPSALYRVNQAAVKVSSRADTRLMLKAEVIDHVDGDTVKVRVQDPPAVLDEVETIRLLGVDTPETVRPNSPVERFGREASDFTRERLLGRAVYVAFDWDLRDRYGRLLAYIYTGQGECFNAALIREGYAYAYLQYPFQFMDEFRSLEREATREKRGLWRN